MADLGLDTREEWQTIYGDIYRLDAFAWMDDLPARSEPVSEQRDAFDTTAGRVRRYWQVAGNNGLGQLSERNIYLALLLLTAEAEWQTRSIDFTFRTLALRSGMRPGKTSYKKIADALDRLTSLLVTFQGTIEIGGKDVGGIRITFYVISDLYKVESEGEVDCTVSWNKEAFRALRSAVQEYLATAPEMSMEEIMATFFVPIDPEKTRPS